jgi:2-aminomuconate deaminase
MPESLSSHKAPEPVGNYPHAKRVGDLLFLSGIGPRKKGKKEIPGVELDQDGNIVSYDIEVQCQSVFENVEQVLLDTGASLANLVDVTVFLTNMSTDFKKYNEAYGEFFKEVRPTRTTVEITALPTPIAIELKCIAYLGD